MRCLPGVYPPSPWRECEHQATRQPHLRLSGIWRRGCRWQAMRGQWWICRACGGDSDGRRPGTAPRLGCVGGAALCGVLRLVRRLPPAHAPCACGWGLGLCRVLCAGGGGPHGLGSVSGAWHGACRASGCVSRGVPPGSARCVGRDGPLGQPGDCVRVVPYVPCLDPCALGVRVRCDPWQGSSCL